MPVLLTIVFLVLNVGQLASTELIPSTPGSAIRPVVTFTPNWGNILQGDDVTLTCDVPSIVREEPRTYSWYKDHQPIHAHQQTLHINSSSTQFSGDYHCEIGGGIISDAVFLNVSRDYVILQRPPSAIYEGDPLTLRCHHLKDFNALNTTFYRNDEEIQSSSNSEYHIDIVHRNVSGLYKCTKRLQHSLSVHEHSDVFQISVKELFSPPQIKGPVHRVMGGDNMMMRCDTTLDPRRTGTELLFAFYKDGRTVRKFRVSNTYRVQPAQLEDSGNYTCEVKTMPDTVRKMSNGLYIQIHELSPPQIKVTPNKVTEGDEMMVRCDTTLHRAGTKLLFAFYRDGRTVREFNVSDTYKVRSAQLEDSGNYHCDMRMPGIVEKKSDVVYIQIHELFSPPKIQVATYNIMEGSNMTVRCDTALDSRRAGTELLFAFYRDGQTVRGLDVSDTYTVQSAQLKDSGYYTCEVKTAPDKVRKNSNGSYIQIAKVYTETNPPVAVIAGAVIGSLVVIIVFAVLIWKCRNRKCFTPQEPPNIVNKADPDPPDVCYTYLDLQKLPKGTTIRPDELTVTYAAVNNMNL